MLMSFSKDFKVQQESGYVICQCITITTDLQHIWELLGAEILATSILNCLRFSHENHELVYKLLLSISRLFPYQEFAFEFEQAQG